MHRGRKEEYLCRGLSTPFLVFRNFHRSSGKCFSGFPQAGIEASRDLARDLSLKRTTGAKRTILSLHWGLAQ